MKTSSSKFVGILFVWVIGVVFVGAKACNYLDEDPIEKAETSRVEDSVGNLTKDEPIPHEWQRIHVKTQFTFFVPPDMKPHVVQAKDSSVGEYRNSNIHLRFDYGWYSDPLDNYSRKPGYQEVKVEIDGKRAKVVTFHNTEENEDFKYVAAVHFVRVRDDKTGLTMWADCKGLPEVDIAKRIFGSIKFP